MKTQTKIELAYLYYSFFDYKKIYTMNEGRWRWNFKLSYAHNNDVQMSNKLICERCRKKIKKHKIKIFFLSHSHGINNWNCFDDNPHGKVRNEIGGKWVRVFEITRVNTRELTARLVRIQFQFHSLVWMFFCFSFGLFGIKRAEKEHAERRLDEVNRCVNFFLIKNVLACSPFAVFFLTF